MFCKYLYFLPEILCSSLERIMKLSLAEYVLVVEYEELTSSVLSRYYYLLSEKPIAKGQQVQRFPFPSLQQS